MINPGAAWPNKRWPPERFGALAAAMRERIGVRSLVLWGPGEEDIAALVVGASGGAAELASADQHRRHLSRSPDGAKLMVSGDTGPLHIAAAVGTPVVALFGPTFAERNGPWSRDDITISRAASDASVTTSASAGCRSRASTTSPSTKSSPPPSIELPRVADAGVQPRCCASSHESGCRLDS